jgi:hypothetical protein
MKNLFLAGLFLSSITFAQAGILDSLGLGGASTNSTATAAVNALSQDQVVGGLKDALASGVQHAVSMLGHDGGYLTNLEVKIPLPDKLQSAQKALHAMGEDKYSDEFIATMNHAAEQAVPVAASVFADAVKQMTVDDAKNILTGPNDAATQYFRRTTSTNLYAKFYPIVQKATAATGVTGAYKKMMAQVTGSSTNSSSGGLFGSSFGGLANKYLGSDALDVDAYVTNKALDGLFKMVADEEKSIRANPMARTTGLMQQVFGALGK